MSYNTKIVREQGGSVLNILSGGSLVVASGAALSFASDTFTLGGVKVLSGRNVPGSTTASPGSLYLRTDGSVSNVYVNVSTGTTGSVWKGASIFN